MGSRRVTCYPTQVNTPRLNPSHAGRYSIYLPRRDGRLSWPSWLEKLQTFFEVITPEPHTGRALCASAFCCFIIRPSPPNYFGLSPPQRLLKAQSKDHFRPTISFLSHSQFVRGSFNTFGIVSSIGFGFNVLCRISGRLHLTSGD